EAGARVVEYHRHVGRHHPILAFAQQLPQHVAERQHRARRLAVGAREAAATALRGLEHGEIGPENERRPVNQEDMVALLELARRVGLSMGHGGLHTTMGGGREVLRWMGWAWRQPCRSVIFPQGQITTKSESFYNSRPRPNYRLMKPIPLPIDAVTP